MTNPRNNIIRDIFNVATIDDLRDINLAIKQRWSELESRAGLNFKVGDSVKFTSRKRGGVQVGVVTKVNRKTIAVRVGCVTWRVPPTMLSAVRKSAAA